MRKSALETKKVLIADDTESIRIVLSDVVSRMGFTYEVCERGDEALTKIKSGRFFLVFLDIVMPKLNGLEVLKQVKDLPVSIVVITAERTIDNAIQAMKEGAYNYLTKPFDLDDIEQIIKQVATSHHQSSKASSKSNIEVSPVLKHQIVGQSPVMEKVGKLIGRISVTHATVLIEGESGTGKDLVARTIHNNSPRKTGPFVVVNCAAIPKELLESELFGISRGAFTGAYESRSGRFESAHQGTLFLDEIGDMPIELQGKLLRVLQEKEIYRLGSNAPKKIDIRLIAATNRNLEKAIAQGSFREDLYWRLAVFVISLPPLRDRVEDISLLCHYFVAEAAKEFDIPPKTIHPDTMKRLRQYPWPGNIRELKNVIHRMMLLTQSPILLPEALGSFLTKNEILENQPASAFEAVMYQTLERLFFCNDPSEINHLYPTILESVEKPLLRLTLKNAGGNQLKAAQMLGINRNTLRNKLRRLGLYTPGDPS